MDTPDTTDRLRALVRDRRLEVRRLPLADLHLDPANARAHGKENLDAIEASLSRFGQAEPLVVQASSGRLIGGNGRLVAMRRLGWTECDVVQLDVDDREATALGIALNRTAELAEWDPRTLTRLLAELREEDSLAGVGFSDDDLDALIAELEDDEPRDLDDPGPEEPPLEPISRVGDLWVLGDHRLLCGDSTRSDDLQHLMAGETAVLMATDPPYLVDYTARNHPPSASNRPETANRDWDAYHDPETGIAFFDSFLKACLPHVAPDAAIYQWHASRRQSLVERAWEMNGLLVHQTVVWVKSRPVLTRSMFMWRSEPCFFGWQKGKMPPKERRPPHNTTNVWEIDTAGEDRADHPCLHPKARVLTEYGLREIQTVAVGDRVLAEDGTFRAVTAVTRHAYTSPDLYRIEARGGNEPTLASDNHPFLVWRPRRGGKSPLRGSCMWLRADQLRRGDYTMTPVLKENREDPFPEKPEEYWFLLGLYIAEGHIQPAGHGSNGYPGFSINSERTDLQDRIRSFWGDRVSRYERPRGEAVTMMVFEPEVGAEFVMLGGRLAHKKRLAPVLLRLPEGKRRALLDGWLNGDGCRVRGHWQAKTTSGDLAAQMAMLAQSVGYRPNVYRYEPPENPEHFGGIGERRFKSRRPEHHLYFYESGSQDRPFMVHYRDGTYVLRFVKSVEQVPYEGDVWNLSVGGSPTFQTAVGMSHNTPKPLEIFARPLEYHTRRGEVVLEPFSGSGSQIIAAEQAGRRCYAMELSPAFVDVAVRRWEGATGKVAVLDGEEQTFTQVEIARRGG